MTGGFELRSAAKRYGGQAVLTDVSCALPPGRHTALLGPTGCGKSTALRLLAGLEPPDAGIVLCNGAEASSPGRIAIAPHRRGVGMVFQDLALWPNLTALENVALGGARDAREALALCGVGALARRRPGALSGGEQQRVALARAIAADPSFLFLDEPFAGLDWATKSDLLAEIAALARRRGFTVLLVSHDPGEVLALTEHVAVLEDGRIVESGAIADLLEQPRTATTRNLRDYASGARPGSAP